MGDLVIVHVSFSIVLSLTWITNLSLSIFVNLLSLCFCVACCFFMVSMRYGIYTSNPIYELRLKNLRTMRLVYRMTFISRSLEIILLIFSSFKFGWRFLGIKPVADIMIGTIVTDARLHNLLTPFFSSMYFLSSSTIMISTLWFVEA